MTIVCLWLILCFNKIGRTAPWNYIAWFIFTCFYSVMVATITSFYDPKSVFICAALTLVMFLTLVFIALTTKRSLPILCAMLVVALVLSIFSLVFLIFFSEKWAVILASIGGLIVASIYVLIGKCFKSNQFRHRHDHREVWIDIWWVHLRKHSALPWCDNDIHISTPTLWKKRLTIDL